MKRTMALGLLAALLAIGLRAAADVKDKDKDPSKEALQALQEFIGQWKANGAPEKAKPAPKELWSESLSWGWNFKSDAPALALQVKDGKLLKGGELRYQPGKKVYEFTAVGPDDKKAVYEGTYDADKHALTLERVDPDSKETQQIVMNTAAEGDRFIARFNHKASGSTLLKKDFLVQATREGVSLGKIDKGNECVVSGGRGTMSVTYKGETYYLCCSGCRDAFNENPEKYIKEYKAKKGIK
jgi:YHS domain-containing protein